ncbi:MAG: S8 family serine peptidase [Acidobacteria bacterium]|nr:S8 family serine peptidase [Acidobacteriota bacterium]
MATRSAGKASRKTSRKATSRERRTTRDVGGEASAFDADEILSTRDVGGPRRFIARLRKDGVRAATEDFSKSAGMRVASTADFIEGVIADDEMGDSDVIILDKLGFAIIVAPEDQVAALDVEEGGPIESIRPERTFIIMGGEFPSLSSPDLGAAESYRADLVAQAAVGSISLSPEYLRGYQSGVNRLIAEITGRDGGDISASTGAVAAALDESQSTWGLQVTSALATPFSGRGVRVAVLDTGLDLNHPDFVGRVAGSKSLIQGVTSAQDGHGHGTHCAGTVCGPLKPSKLPRYGVAPNVELFVGKVLRDSGSGPESAILSGINWALTQGCRVISMSLGSPVGVGDPPDDDYEEVGRVALEQNCLIIAAAGNESSRPSTISPVGIPANSTNIMAVAALQFVNSQQFRVAVFSNGGINPGGGKVDIAGPGVAVRSSWSATAFGPTPLAPSRPPTGTRYHSISGTSMATPHVAGVTALLMERDPGATADQIMHRLTQTAKSLPLPARDVGSGLVQAP